MPMSNVPLPYPSALQLGKLQEAITPNFLREQFSAEPDRFARFSTHAAGLLLDYTKNHINDEIMVNLQQLAQEARVEEQRDAMLRGDAINHTEQRAVLHTALRRRHDQPVMVDGEDVMPAIANLHKRMATLADQIGSGDWKGYTGKPIKHIVNIGIGGSYLGLKMVVEALRPYHRPSLTAHFVANVDPSDLHQTLSQVDPETTLFIIASKTFTTLETLANAEAARHWFLQQGATEADIARHFIAVSCNLEAAGQFGIAQDNILPLWDWVGGRYSLWSVVGLIIALMAGMDQFNALLAGAREMDEHFASAPLEENMPVIMALLGVWYSNFGKAQSQAIISYDHNLRYFVPHLQQMDMESNGKSASHEGRTLDYSSGPIIWGGTGTNDQHAYMQLLHQGNRLIPADFILTAKSHNDINGQHAWLFANGLAQTQALLYGRNESEVIHELQAKGLSTTEIERLAPHKIIPGNRPTNTLLIEQLTPETLGALIALYEHKVFVQGAIWNINSFDQWGVELGKQLGQSIHSQLDQGSLTDMDSSTTELIKRYRQAQ